MYVYIYIRVCLYISMYIYVQMQILASVYMHAYTTIKVSIYIYMFIYINVFRFFHISLCNKRLSRGTQWRIFAGFLISKKYSWGSVSFLNNVPWWRRSTAVLSYYVLLEHRFRDRWKEDHYSTRLIHFQQHSFWRCASPTPSDIIGNRYESQGSTKISGQNSP